MSLLAGQLWPSGDDNTYRSGPQENMMSHAIGSPGEVAWVSIFNSLENRASTGKFRPAVLVARNRGMWATMGLTTHSTYGDCTPRVAIPNPLAVGLRGPGFLWGDRLTPVSPIDLGDHIGWADAALVEAVIRLASLDGAWAEGLRKSVGASDVVSVP